MSLGVTRDHRVGRDGSTIAMNAECGHWGKGWLVMVWSPFPRVRRPVPAQQNVTVARVSCTLRRQSRRNEGGPGRDPPSWGLEELRRTDVHHLKRVRRVLDHGISQAVTLVL